MTNLAIILIVVLAILWISKQHRSTDSTGNNNQILEKNNVENIEEETVFKIQSNFEEKLQETYLPDSIGRQEIYIYKNLMRPWYDKLSSKDRYDDAMIQKLRNDWIDYMNALGDRSTYNYLSLEAEKKEDENSYRNDHIIASRKVFTIENAFASVIGNKEKEKLARIRGLNFSAFNRNNGDIAPDGFEFDANNKLRKKIII